MMRTGRRWVRALVLMTLLLAALVAGRMSGGAGVGHFASPAARARFMAAYERAFASLPAPDQTRDIRTPFGTVRVYRFAGPQLAGTPLFLLPGRAAPAPVWSDLIPALVAERPVYAIDLLGEPGLSIQDTPITSDADQAAWLHAVLTQLPESEVHVVGLSIGGWTAMNLAVRQPERIASLTLIEPVFVFAPMRLEAIVRSIPASVPWFPKSWRDGFNSWTAGGAPVTGEPVAQMIEAGMQTYRLSLPVPGLIDEERMKALPIPTLVILAGSSPMHDSQAAADTARRVLRQGTVKVYPGTSHAITGERPADIVADIDGHVRMARPPASRES
ncbi:MAG TPA: alpha/beta fold hydrolase [Vicinamibacterales bacterium]